MSTTIAKKSILSYVLKSKYFVENSKRRERVKLGSGVKPKRKKKTSKKKAQEEKPERKKTIGSKPKRKKPNGK